MSDWKISRRGSSPAPGVTAAAALGPTAVFAAPAAAHGGGHGWHGRDRLIPDDKTGTITFTQRDVPSRVGIAASAALGVAPTMGYLGGPDFPEDPTDLGPLVPLPGGWRELFEFLASAGFKQIEFAGYGQNAEQPRRRGAQPGTRRRDHAGVAGGLPRVRPDAARLPRRVRPGGDRQPRLHPEHLARAEQPGRRHVDGRLRAVPDRAGVRVDPRHAVHGHRQRPDERQQPQHRAVDDRRREVGGAQRPQPAGGASSCTRTTTRPRTTSSRTARWSPSPRTG